MNAVILLGPPGAGKGTVSEVLVDQGFKHISTGQLLREQIALGTPQGIEARKRIDHGNFVPDEVVIGMIQDLLEKAPEGQKFLFDGFPRTMAQAEKLDDLLEQVKGNLGRVVLLDCPDEVLVERITGRRSCDKCGSVYHMKFNPPSQGEQCDEEGCQLTQRPDDTEETVRKRIGVYEERTSPLIDFYEEKKLVEHIDASQSIDEVRAAVVQQLG